MLRPWRRQVELQLRLFCCVLGTSVTRRSRPLVESECACKLLRSKWRVLAFAALRNTFSISEHTTIHSNVHMHSDPAARPLPGETANVTTPVFCLFFLCYKVSSLRLCSAQCHGSQTKKGTWSTAGVPVSK